MREALETANEMQSLGIIGAYAVIGSVAVIYWGTPTDTGDLDIAFLHGLESHEIFSMSEIYRYFDEHDLKVEDFTVWIGGVKVQFVPSTGPLSDEAIAKAQDVVWFDVKTRVALPEYVIALKLVASRTKDYTHILNLLSNAQVDFSILNGIISRFELKDKWNRFLGATLWGQ